MKEKKTLITKITINEILKEFLFIKISSIIVYPELINILLNSTDILGSKGTHIF